MFFVRALTGFGVKFQAFLPQFGQRGFRSGGVFHSLNVDAVDNGSCPTAALCASCLYSLEKLSSYQRRKSAARRTSSTRELSGVQPPPVQRIWTVVATCVQQGRLVFQFLLDSVQAHSSDATQPSAPAVRPLTTLPPFSYAATSEALIQPASVQ
jgi:hypothetical protein